MTQKHPLLSIQNLSIAFRHKNTLRSVVSGVNLTINSGDAIALVGESGSGKSVTAQTILRLLPENDVVISGSILFDGQDILQMVPREINKIRGRRISMIFQDPMRALNPTMTIGKQISEVLTKHLNRSSTEAKEEAIRLLDQVQIAEPRLRYDAFPFQLSGGMRQRVLIAMAIACQPDLLIADEPTTALDVTIQAQILTLLKKIRNETGMSLLFITHDLVVASNICERVAVMRHGTIVEEGSVDILFTDPNHTYTKELLLSV